MPEVEKLKSQLAALLEDVAKLQKAQKESESLTEQLQQRADKLEKRILQQEQEMRKTEAQNEEHLKNMHQDNKGLEKQVGEMHETYHKIQEKIKKMGLVSASGTERKMIFKGKSSKNMTNNQMKVKPQILQPVAGGSALITFDLPEVASNVIGRSFTIPVEGCEMKVSAEAVELMELDSVGLDMTLCSYKVLVSDLPSLPEDLLLDKLELFFSKTRNGGGEVDSREYLADSRSALLTFASQEVAQGLTGKKIYEVPFGGSSHKVHVTSSLNGNIKEFQIRKSVCNKTVLVTGIPDIMEEETLKDMLQIYFQKPSNGGGEINAILYCPEGRCTLATFEDEEDV
uniref:NID domain-containing protein n=1 Tax=Leptobrachium leishanense TaxID=445787 RepID=A0A8C5WIK7_9ANUR